VFADYSGYSGSSGYDYEMPIDNDLSSDKSGSGMIMYGSGVELDNFTNPETIKGIMFSGDIPISSGIVDMTMDNIEAA